MDPLEYVFSLEAFGIKAGLANIRALCTALGQPQNKYRSVLIAGTNGKGSVTAMVDCGLRAAELKVGRYTSPHLVHLEERFTIDGKNVDTNTLRAEAEHVRAAIERMLAAGSLDAPPTFFEATTAIAFNLFKKAEVDIAVLEVGLGGRLDATNIVDPVAAAITSIDFDHEQHLGNTLAAIAGEKAGVIRPGIPVVVGPLADEARHVLVSMCAKARADYIDAEEGAQTETHIVSGRTMLTVKTPVRDYGRLTLGLRGAHQVANALIAIRLLEQLEKLVPIDADAIAAGVSDVRWPGRLQLVEAESGKCVLLDAAHNPAGAWVLAKYLKREFPEPIPLVFGAMRDKDAALMLKTLLPVSSAVIMTEPHNPRARSAEELAELARSFSPRCAIEIVAEPKAALDRAWHLCPLVCVAGSVFLVGDVLSGLGPGARTL